MSEKEKNTGWLDYVTREDFIELVHQGGADQAVEQWLQKEPSAPAVELKQAADKIVRLSDKKDLTTLAADQKNAWWQKIEEETLAKKSSGKLISLRNWRHWGIVASLALLMGLGYLYYQNVTWTNIQMVSAEQTEIELPDGSLVQVNASSEISYHSRSFEKERRIRLDGEAFFEVEEGSSFTVETKMGHVRVLGTSFNVRQREKSLHVACKTGKVEVTSADGQKLVLTRGEALRYSGGLAEIEEYRVQNPGQIASWRQGKYALNNVRFEEAVRELERQFDVQVEVPAQLGAKTGNFYFTGSNLDSALYQLSWPLNANFRKKESEEYEIYMSK